MRECYVSFSSAADIQEFVAIATRQGYPIQVGLDANVTSAKSIMGIFSMGLHRPLRVTLQCEAEADAANFLSAVAPFLVS